MKKLILLLILLMAHASMYAQDITSLEIHRSCNLAARVCQNIGVKADPTTSASNCTESLVPQYFKFDMTEPGNITLMSHTHTGTYTLYGPMMEFSMNSCQQIALGQVTQVSGALSSTVNIPHSQGHYVLKVDPVTCDNIDGVYLTRFEIDAPQSHCRDRRFGCKDCIGSFSPQAGKYLVSAWVQDDLSDKRYGYENPSIIVSFVGPPTTFNLQPSGAVIDDWQRIDGVVTIPSEASEIKIALSCENGDCYFDDIRFIPMDGSMLSYVYDPVTLRLVAELDERNFATLYEYDEEGKLIRTKKETEKGIMTITEGRNNIRK